MTEAVDLEYRRGLDAIRQALRDGTPHSRALALGIVQLFAAAQRRELSEEARRAPIVSALVGILSRDLKGA